MVIYKKENGFPATLYLHTNPMHDEENDWEGWKTIVKDEDDNVIGTFNHNELHSRVIWVNGYFEGLKNSNPYSVKFGRWLLKYTTVFNKEGLLCWNYSRKEYDTKELFDIFTDLNRECI